VRPRVVLVADPARYPDDAKANLDLLADARVEVSRVEGDALATALDEADLVVDAVFGVGLSRRVEGSLAGALAALAGCPCPLLSVDVPSGLSSDRGAALGPRIRPARVVTLGLPKLGLALWPEDVPVDVAEIGLPAAAVEAAGVAQSAWTPRTVAARLPLRPVAAHKGRFGHLLVVAGSEGKSGAAALAGAAAVRAGAGLVTVAVPRPLNPVLEVKLTEAMTLPCDADGPGFAASAADAVLAAAGARDGVVIGPGLGGTDGARALARRLVDVYRGPLVVDADGLNAFAGEPEILRSAASRVLTPHPGELARLLGRGVPAIEEDRVAAVREAASRTGCVTLLKGRRTVIARPDGRLVVNRTGGPGLASGGTGDVLAGLIGALLVQGLEAFDAAAVGAWLHGSAGDALGTAGVTATELADALPSARSDLLRAARARDDEDAEIRAFG